MASFDANLLFVRHFLDVGMFATANSGTVMHQIEARSDETHSILQIYMTESGLMCIGDTVGDDRQLKSYLLAVDSDMLVLLTSPPPISIPHSN